MGAKLLAVERSPHRLGDPPRGSAVEWPSGRSPIRRPARSASGYPYGFGTDTDPSRTRDSARRGRCPAGLSVRPWMFERRQAAIHAGKSARQASGSRNMISPGRSLVSAASSGSTRSVHTPTRSNPSAPPKVSASRRSSFADLRPSRKGRQYVLFGKVVQSCKRLTAIVSLPHLLDQSGLERRSLVGMRQRRPHQFA